MDNSSRAIIMGGSILLFVIGLSIGVFLYSQVMEANNTILTNSEYFDRAAENYVASRDIDTKRTISGAEVANQLLDITRHTDDFTYKEININGTPYSINNLRRYIYDVDSGDSSISAIDFTQILETADSSSFYNLSNFIKGIVNNSYQIQDIKFDDVDGGVIISYVIN